MTDQRLEKMVSNLLRIGVVASACVVAFGGCIYLSQHGGDAADYHTFRSVPAIDRSLTAVLAGCVRFRARSLIEAGILLLIATPILRVVAALVGFALERDRQYLLISAIVLSVLTFSVISGSLQAN